MINGDQPKMDALTPVIGQALNVRDQLRVEMGNQMGLGSDGWASQNPNMLEQKTYGTEPLSTDINRFTPEQRSKMGVVVGESALEPEKATPIKGLTPEERSKAWAYVGKDAVIEPNTPKVTLNTGALTPEEQSKRRVIVGEDAGAGQYIDDMSQTYGGMSEGLEAAQANTREAIVNSLSPELQSKADVYVGIEPEVEAGKEPITTGLSPELLAKADAYVGEGIRIKEIEDKEVKSLTDKIDRYFNDMIFMSNEDFFERYPADHKGLAAKWEKELASYIPENGEEQSRHHFEGYENMIASINQDNIDRVKNGIDPYGSADVTKQTTQIGTIKPGQTPIDKIHGYFQDECLYLDGKITSQDFFKKYPDGPLMLEKWKNDLVETLGSGKGEAEYWDATQHYENLIASKKDFFLTQDKEMPERIETVYYRDNPDEATLRANGNYYNETNIIDYNVENRSHEQVDINVMNAIATIAMGETGAWGQGRQNQFDDPNQGLNISMMGFSRDKLTYKEALNILENENEQADEYVLMTIDMFKSLEDPREAVEFILGNIPNMIDAEKLINIDNDIIGAFISELGKEYPSLENVFEKLSDPEGKIIKGVLGALRSIHEDVTKITGGTYLTAELLIEPNNGQLVEQTDANLIPSGQLTNKVMVRIIELEDGFVNVTENPYCHTIPLAP